VTPRTRTCALLALVLALGGRVGQGAPATPRESYTAAVAREQALRAPGRAAPSIKEYRSAIAAYDAVVRQFPTSGYVDNALWQGAAIAREAFDRFGDDRDRATARRMLDLLVNGYPASPFVSKARDVLTGLEERASRRVVVLRTITRTAMPDRVRVTLEFDAPTTYRTERVESPDRVLFDLADTRLGEAVPEGTLSYDDVAVRRMRIALHANQVARVVLDLDGVARYSVSTLERPYRIVIDCTRAAGFAGRPPTARPAGPARPASARPPAMRAIPPPETRPPLPARRALVPWTVAPSAEPTDAESLRLPLTSFALPRPGSPLLAPAAEPPPPSLFAPAPDALPAPAPHPVSPPGSAPGAASPTRPPAPGRGPYSLARQLGLGASKIVIDPGHGGHDPGALGQGVSEADIVLDVALRLESLLREAGVEVVLTRRSDQFVPLEERPAIAMREQADLFLSIHANAARNRAVRGIESYVLNFSTDPDAEAVAARENSATGRTMNNLPDIVKAITLNSKLDESRSFASLIQRAMAAQLSDADTGLRNLGVKQAPFVVLIGASMPSVLVEISFLTNPQEGRLLRTGAYRQRIARALFDAIRGYQQTLKHVQAEPSR
jgi:N-acetylmuramoyl-L-alanine amidase